MKKILLASVAAFGLVAALASPSAAFQWNIVGGGFGAIGGSFSNVNNFAGSQSFGTSSATGSTQGFAKAESAIGYGQGVIATNSNGNGNGNQQSAGNIYGNFVGGTAATGSLSNGTSSTAGNGFASVSTGGTSSAGTGVIGVGGFVSAP